MNVGEIGIQIVLTPAGISGDLTGATVSMQVRSPEGPSQAVTGYAMVVAFDHLTASYTTNGSEFPIAGVYELQFVIVRSGQTLKSAIQTLSVGPSLS